MDRSSIGQRTLNHSIARPRPRLYHARQSLHSLNLNTLLNLMVLVVTHLHLYAYKQCAGISIYGYPFNFGTDPTCGLLTNIKYRNEDDRSPMLDDRGQKG